MRYVAKVGRLKNNLLYVSQYDSSNTNNVGGVGVKVGSIHDPPDKQGSALMGMSGLAHLIEHMRCRESPNWSGRKVDLTIEKYLGGLEGSDINIRIDHVSTYFGFNNLLKRKHFFECLDMMANLVRYGTLNQEGLEVEKAAVHQEYYLRGIDALERLIDDLVHQVMYKFNTVRRRIDCEPDQLENIALQDVRRFVGRYYTPSNIFVIGLGPRHEEVKHLAEKYFDDWKVSRLPNFQCDNSEEIPELKEIQSLEIERPGAHQYHVAISFPTESYMSKDAEALDVLARIWAFRLKDRLRKKNRDFNKGAYRELCFTPRTFVHGMIYAWFATQSEEFAREGERIILEEAKKLTQELVFHDELDAMVSNFDFNYLDAFRNNATVLQEMIIEAICNGDEDLSKLHSFRDRLYRVTRRKVRETAVKYFEDNYARVVIKPV